MKAMKQIVVVVSLVVISAMAPVVEAQQGVEKASKLSSKDEIVAALEASFAFNHKAIGTITNANAFENVGGRAPSGATIPSTRCTQAAYIAVHASDEYGQMVEYLRVNGITPPASGAPAPPKK